MPTDTPTPQPSFEDRRAYFRITVVLPISIQPETATTEGPFTEQSVNVSGGGIGMTVPRPYNPNEILSLTLLLPDQVVFKSFVEVLRVEPITTSRIVTYRVHARFVRMAAQDRELLIRCILRFQRDHLQRHYSV
jgi:c-di-GMP-binding flagellar brake protein YcgR